LAETCLLLDSARQYGLVTGGPEVDVARCLELLDRGRQLGHVPTTAGTDACIQAFVAQGGTRIWTRRRSASS
jgi:hypothetical protein